MNINIRNYVPMYLEGGEMPVDLGAAPMEGAPVEEGVPVEGEQDPAQQLLIACQQALESQDCNLAMQVCQIVLQMVGGQQEAPAAPEGAQPVYRRGGRLSRWIKK